MCAIDVAFSFIVRRSLPSCEVSQTPVEPSKSMASSSHVVPFTPAGHSRPWHHFRRAMYSTTSST